MKIAFDVDVLSKQMSINDLVHQVADWGYKYIEQSPHPRINPFYKHPLFSKECEEEYRKALKETGVEISSFICVYRWSGPTEEQRKMAVANWKKMIEIAVNMGVPVINTELSGDPNQQEICNGMWFRSMEELLPIIEREGLRVEIQSHPYDFCELNDEACDMVKSFRSKNLGYVYSSPHGFFYDQGKGDVRYMLKYAGDELTHVLFADTSTRRSTAATSSTRHPSISAAARTSAFTSTSTSAWATSTSTASSRRCARWTSPTSSSSRMPRRSAATTSPASPSSASPRR